MKRRTFVGGAFAGIVASSARIRAAKAGDIPQRTFGKTGQKLTVIGQAGGRLNKAGDDEARKIVRRAYDLGINYFDYARGYWDGHSEEVCGEVIQPFRKEIFLTTKSNQRTRKGAEEELHQSLKALRTDYLDLWQIWSVAEMEDVDKIFAPGGAIEAFEAAKKAGKCRYIGFTGHVDPHVHAEMLKRYDNYDTIFMPLHIADPNYLSFQKIVLPEAVKRGLGIQAMKSTGNAGLLKQFSLDQCLSYTLSLPIHCAAMGATKVSEIEDDVRAAQNLKTISEADRAALTEQAKAISGPELENWKRKPESAGLVNIPYMGG